MAADSYLYKDKLIFFRRVPSVKRYYGFCWRKLQFPTKFCQQHYGDLKKVTSGSDHRQKGSTRAQFYWLQKSTTLPTTKERDSTAYKRAQFYCLQKSTILLPRKEHNSTDYKTAQFNWLQKSTILLPTKEHNSTDYKRAQFYWIFITGPREVDRPADRRFVSILSQADIGGAIFSRTPCQKCS